MLKICKIKWDIALTILSIVSMLISAGIGGYTVFYNGKINREISELANKTSENNTKNTNEYLLAATQMQGKLNTFEKIIQQRLKLHEEINYLILSVHYEYISPTKQNIYSTIIKHYDLLSSIQAKCHTALSISSGKYWKVLNEIRIESLNLSNFLNTILEKMVSVKNTKGIENIISECGSTVGPSTSRLKQLTLRLTESFNEEFRQRIE